MARVLFLTTAHNYNDDRIFHHQAKELISHGYDVKICSLYCDYSGNIDGIEVESYDALQKSSTEKINLFQKVCSSFRPDCIIGSEPLAVIAAKNYAKINNVDIIYDITEWYPSQRMLKKYPLILKILHGVKFFLIQLYAGLISKGFIFGEDTKKFPLAHVFPWKNKIILPYYPSERFITESIKKLDPNEIKLCYTGLLTKEKGIENFFNAADSIRKKRPHLKVSVILIGGTRTKADEIYFSELLKVYNWEDIKIEKPVSFDQFTDAFADADICFDLREITLENNHCLPIKLFYYIAAGKPIIYSDLKATRNHLDTSSFGYLVDPENTDQIAKFILDYVDNSQLYDRHANNARIAFETKYNWGTINTLFINFIKSHL